MLRINNIKRKIVVSTTAAVAISLSAWGVMCMTFTPEYTYAIEDPRTMNDIDYMQEITPTICNNTPEADTAGNNQFTLTDKRDNKTYTVAKLKDGNCWMTQNLAIIDKTISSADSDIEAGQFKILASDKTDFNGNYQNTSKVYYDGSNYGGYYNWYTATAGSIIESGDAPNSICPKGWRMPIGGSTNINKSYVKLLDGLTTGDALLSYPYKFMYGGNIQGDKFSSDKGQAGYYWTSTGNRSAYAYSMSFISYGIYPSGDSGIRAFGLSVRCVNSDTRYNDNLYIPPLGENQAYGDIAVTIPAILTVDAASEVGKNTTPEVVTDGTITATVGSNTEYEIFLSAEETNLINDKDSGGVNIPASSNVVPRVNGWGMRTAAGTYVPITTTMQKYDNNKTTDTVGNDIYTYGLGISIAPSLPAGTYSTDVTVTVSPK